MAEFDEIITYIEALHEVENCLSCVEDELKDIKQTVKQTHRPWALAIPRKAIAHTSQTAERETHEKSQQQQAERRQERAKLEVNLTTEGAPRTTQNRIANDTHET